MGIQQFIRKMRGQPHEEVTTMDDLTDEQRALVEEWSRSLAELTPAQIDEIEQRALREYEVELRQAAKEIEEHRAARRRLH